MSAVTLFDLVADFIRKEAAHTQFIKGVMPRIDADWSSPEFTTIKQENHRLLNEVEKAKELLKVVCSQSNEKDGLEAAMLYKLSNGACDPREGE